MEKTNSSNVGIKALWYSKISNAYFIKNDSFVLFLYFFFQGEGKGERTIPLSYIK